MNKIIISIIGIFVMTGLVYALATFTVVGGGLVGHWALDAESYDSNTERITDKTPYENHGTGNLSSVELVRNGNAETGDTSNWNFDGVDSNDYHSGAYSFYEQGGKTVTSGDFIPVDINREYNLEGWFKSNGTGGESKLYFGYIPYDENKVRIAHEHVHVILGTETTLYEACNSEDKIVKIVDGTNWYDTITHEFMAFDIDDSGNYNDLPNRELSNVNIINLTDQGDYWEVEFNTNVGKTYPIGTKVRMHISGGSYMYVAAGGVLVPTSWTQYVDSSGVKGESLYGTGYDTWWRGTRYARILMLANYQQSADYKLKVDDISLIYTGATLTTDRMGQGNRAMSFNGKTARDRISFGSFTIGTTGTYNLWIKGDKTSGIQRSENIYPLGIQMKHSLLGPSSGVTGRYGLITDDGTNRYYDWGNQDVYDNEWHMYTVAWDGTYVYAWLDGISVGAPKAHSGQIFSGTGNFYAGAGWASTYGTHTGELGEVRLYDQVLSIDEIDTLYHSYRPKASSGSLQKGLVGHWTLDGEDYNPSTSRVTDSTPYLNHGTNYGATLTEDRFGKSEGAMGFDDGSNPGDYIGIPYTFVNVSSLTLSIWAKTNSSSGQNLFNNHPFILHFRGAGFYLRDNAAGVSNYLGWNYAFQNDVWYHISATWNGSVMKVYVNGIQTNSMNWTGSGVLSSSSSVNIGRYFNTGQVSFTGSLDDARIYTRALSADEIDTLYHSYRPKASSGSLQKGLVLDMPLNSKYTKDETAGSEVMTDRTPYSNDGQNYGATVGSDYTSFDGVDDYVMLTSAITLGDELTIGMWFNKFDSGVMIRTLIAKNAAAQQKIFFATDNTLGVRTVLGIVYKDIGYTADMDGSWHMLMVTRDASNVVKAWLDAGTPITFMTEAGDSIWQLIGKSLDANQIWKGNISDIRIYNRALSESEIKLIYDKGR